MFSLDHVIVAVRDLDAAALAYRRLGFDLTPRGGHPSLGTANHTIVFERDYLELLTVVVPGPSNVAWSRLLERGDGLGGMALGGGDARETHRELAQRGLVCPPVTDFERPVVHAGMSKAARFSVCLFPPEASPALPAFLCQHHTPDLVWLDAHRRHPNTASGVARLTIVHREPVAVRAGYERLLGADRVRPRPGGLELDLGNTRVYITDPKFAADRLGHSIELPPDGIRPLGLTVTVGSLEAGRAVLAAAGVPFAPSGKNTILIPPGWTHGVYLELQGAG